MKAVVLDAVAVILTMLLAMAYMTAIICIAVIPFAIAVKLMIWLFQVSA